MQQLRVPTSTALNGINGTASFLQLSQDHLMIQQQNLKEDQQCRSESPNQGHYSQPLPLNNDRQLHLNEDHYRDNYEYGKHYTIGINSLGHNTYIHRNSHYSMPFNHDQPPSPAITPPPPALPVRNGSVHSNTTGRRSNTSRHYH